MPFLYGQNGHSHSLDYTLTPFTERSQATGQVVGTGYIVNSTVECPLTRDNDTTHNTTFSYEPTDNEIARIALGEHMNKIPACFYNIRDILDTLPYS